MVHLTEALGFVSAACGDYRGYCILEEKTKTKNPNSCTIDKRRFYSSRCCVRVYSLSPAVVA